MKQLKKVIAVILAIMMLFALTTAASAATVTVTNGVTGHTFKAYKIFSGTYVAEGSLLVDIDWAADIAADAFKTAVKASTNADLNGFDALAETATADDYAKEMAKLNSNKTAAEEIARIAYANKAGDGTSITDSVELDNGYYLVYDATTLAQGDAANFAILAVLGDSLTITDKQDAPTVEKKVKENSAGITGTYGDGYNDIADYTIGDAVPFKLIGSVPDMQYYTTYKYVFHDTLDAGLTAPAQGSVKVYLSDDKTAEESEAITAGYTVAVTGQNITVTFENLKAVTDIAAGKNIIVEYSAVLNANANIGLDTTTNGNKNTVYLEYSNNPNAEGTGNTVEDKVVVYTYELDIEKVDGAQTVTKLQGAEFVLKNSDGSKYAVVADGKITGWADAKDGATTLQTNADGKIAVQGLDAGTYKLEETKAPTSYNKLTSDITVVITSTAIADRQAWTDSTALGITAIAVTADAVPGTAENGKATITVANNKGTTLPTTGGIGTTIFYIAGSVLVLLAVVLFVAKRRTNKAESK